MALECDQLTAINNLTTECEINLKIGNEKYYLVTPKYSEVKTIRINNNSLVHKGVPYFQNLGGSHLISKNAYPIPPGFLKEENQIIYIEWLKLPYSNEISIQKNIRNFATNFINYIPMLFVLSFMLIIYFLKNDFTDTHFFKLSLITGIFLAFHLYMNSMEPYFVFPNHMNFILKLHVLSTSLTSCLLIALADNSFQFFKKKYYWSAFIITFILFLATPGFEGNNYEDKIVKTLFPSMIITTLTIALVLFKILRNKLYQKDNGYFALIISGAIVTVICVIDSLIAMNDRFGEPPISGFGLLLSYIITILTFIIHSKKIKINHLAIHEKVADVSRQVAHDIKSPLAALKIIAESIHEIPSQKKHLVKRSIERIDDIINDLQQKGLNQDLNDSALLINSVINSVISEKRLTLKNKNIKIINNSMSGMNLRFIKGNRSSIKRMISNIINNSIEAMKNNEGEISIIASLKMQNKCQISIKDNGHGIPQDILERITDKNFTYNKPGGQGLGLSYVYEQVQKSGGEFRVESKINEGTTIEFTIPTTSIPNWFCSEIFIHHIDQIYLVDDDISIYEIWKSIFSKFNKSIIHIQNPLNFIENLKLYDQKNHLILVDLDFIGSEISGFEIMKKINHADKILSTSRFEENTVQNFCLTNNYKLLSKDLLNEITIHDHIEIVLIDNDELICQTWALMAKKHHVKFSAYANANEFINHQKNIFLFVDQELGDQKKGLDIARELAQKGYKNIYLCTGHNDISIENYPYLKGIIGKDFPINLIK